MCSRLVIALLVTYYTECVRGSSSAYLKHETLPINFHGLQKRAAQFSNDVSPGYVCVPAGTCTNASLIDARIDSPNICPTGQVPCYGGQPTPPCGIRYVNPSSIADGPTTFGAYPWQAYILNETTFTGSGVLLDQFHVLTVAHKVHLNVNTPANIRVIMGVWNPANRTATQNFTAARVILHPNFANDTLRNDVAIVRLSSPATLGLQVNIATACLAGQAQSYVGRECVVAGWGQSAFGANDAPTSNQRQATVPIVDYNTCRTSMSRTNLGNLVDRYLDPAGEVCAGGRAQVDACTQDGGSPLICADQGRYYVVGLVIWGKRCGQPGVYGVYVYVPYYTTWITQTIARLSAG